MEKRVVKTDGEMLKILRQIVRDEELDQDFIFLTGLNRYEYSCKHKIFVVETRQFDQIPLEEEQEVAPIKSENNIPSLTS